MVYIAICDDEDFQVLITKELLESWALESGTSVEIYCFHNGDDLLSKSKLMRFDVVFLDIMMPMLNGIDTAKELRQRDKAMRIIFLTAFSEFALESYAVKAWDYCIKPVTYEIIENVMGDYMLFNKSDPKSIIIKTLGGYERIYLHNIECIEANNKKVCFYMTNGHIKEVIQPLYIFEKQLTEKQGFVKCHRSYLVYVPNIQGFTIAALRTKTGFVVPISRTYIRAFKEAYFTIMMREEKG